MSEQAQQSVRILTQEEIDTLESRRELVKCYLNLENAEAMFETAQGKMEAISAILSSNTFDPEDTPALQSLGVLFGDVFVADIDFHWVMVEDSIGTDPAIRFENTGLLIYPLTILSKRLAKGEQVDIFQLYATMVQQIQQALDQNAEDGAGFSSKK